MKKLIIPIVIGVSLGLGGSTAAVVLLGKEPASLEEGLSEALGETGADSVAVGDSLAAHSDSIAPVADSLALAHAAPVADTTIVTGSSDNGLPVPGTVQYTTTQAPTTAPATGGLASADLAGLFGSMQPREAARVLEHMDDFEVQVILGQLGKREAAAILSNLTPERAAVISRSIIRSERSAQ